MGDQPPRRRDERGSRVGSSFTGGLRTLVGLPTGACVPGRFRRELVGSARGSSIPLSYVLTLAITAILLSSLVSAAGSLVDERRDSVAREELRVVGEHVTARLMAADRLAATDPSSLAVRGRFPSRIAGRPYRVTVDTGGARPVVHLRVDSPNVVVEVPFVTRTPVVETTVVGGDLEVVLAGGSLEVRPG